MQEFESWGDAILTYNAEHPDEHVYRTVKSKGRFRKDVRDCYRQTTGLELDWQPDRRGGPAKIVFDALASSERVQESAGNQPERGR